MRMHDLDDFTRGYVEAMLWAETDDNDDPLDKNYEVSDITFESMNVIIEECKQFQLENWDMIKNDFSLAGHKFWLNRNGHGVGFWDGSYPEPNATVLSDRSEEFGEVYVFVDDGGNITIESSWIKRQTEVKPTGFDCRRGIFL